MLVCKGEGFGLVVLVSESMKPVSAWHWARASRWRANWHGQKGKRSQHHNNQLLLKLAHSNRVCIDPLIMAVLHDLLEPHIALTALALAGDLGCVLVVVMTGLFSEESQLQPVP